MNKHAFCPSCGIGLNNMEVNLGCCRNCESFFDQEDIAYLNDNNQPWSEEDEERPCPKCGGEGYIYGRKGSVRKCSNC